MKMSALYFEGTRIPVTWVSAGPCVVTQIKNKTKDGYWAVQLGFQTKKLKSTSKPLQGHLKTIIKDNKAPKTIREIRVTEEPTFAVGDMITISKIFRKGDVIAVTGTSKGKGFAGGIKRHGFHGGPKTHGQSDRHRAPGSIGQGTTPGRVLKGKRMAGRMGNDTVTIKNLMVVDVDNAENRIAISGGVPGTVGSLLFIKRISEGNLEDLMTETEAVVVEEETPSSAEATAGEGSGDAQG